MPLKVIFISDGHNLKKNLKNLYVLFSLTFMPLKLKKYIEFLFPSLFSHQVLFIYIYIFYPHLSFNLGLISGKYALNSIAQFHRRCFKPHRRTFKSSPSLMFDFSSLPRPPTPLHLLHSPHLCF